MTSARKTSLMKSSASFTSGRILHQSIIHISSSIKENNDKHGIEMGDIEGIGMGVPGPIKDDGTVLKCVNLGRVVYDLLGLR